MSAKGFPCGMRQMEEKHVPNQVDLMVWSNRLDLLALSNVKGEVQVHRLHWQKVVNLPPPKENVTVRALAWRPDGKAIAIGYSSGSVHIVEIEDKKILHQYDLEKEPSEEFSGTHHGITCITWAVKTGVGEGTEYNVYDDSSIFLQKLQPAGSSSGYKSQSREDTVKELKETQDPTQLNMLLVGYGTGHIYMSVYGRYLYGTIHLTEIVKDDCGEYNILDINLSDDFSILQVFYLDRMSNNSFLALLNTSVLSAYSTEIFSVANRHGQIIQLLSHLDNTMTSITEAWEHILLEMDTKMAYYAASVPEGGVSADLLELLMLGVPSDELELFLLQELTTKGLKKVGNSVELSYSTIQKLVLNQLNIVGQNLAYHLSELRGLTRIPDRYQILGIEESQVTDAIKSCCAFLNKCLELQQVIDTSMRNYKAFFRWLYVVMNRLLDEQIPTEIAKMAQQDLTHIAEFLYNFDNVQNPRGAGSLSEKPVKFNLERLGQYLQDQDLTILPDDEGNPWHTFLNENPCLVRDDNNDTVFSMAPFKKFSLVQQQNYLRKSIQKLFNATEKDASKHFSLLSNMNCTDYKISAKYRNHIKATQTFSESDDTFMTAFMNTTDVNTEIFFVSVCTKTTEGKPGNVIAHKFNFSSCFLRDVDQSTSDIEENLPILDMQFYTPEYLSVIVRHPHSQEDTVFIQLPINKALENSEKCIVISNSSVFNDNTQKKNVSTLLDQNVYKVLDKMDGYRIAVSGGRKVAVVLSKSLRKVRVFEMEVDAEDEDETLTSPDLKAKSENTLTPEKENNMLL